MSLSGNEGERSHTGDLEGDTFFSVNIPAIFTYNECLNDDHGMINCTRSTVVIGLHVYITFERLSALTRMHGTPTHAKTRTHTLCSL